MARVKGGTDELARDLAMHLSFTRARYLSRDDVPAAAVEQEREELSSMEDVRSKPDNVREKMVEGRLKKWFAENVLLEQEWFRGTGNTVQQELGDMEVREFAVYALGA
jgi:elongation factor Ts